MGKWNKAFNLMINQEILSDLYFAHNIPIIDMTYVPSIFRVVPELVDIFFSSKGPSSPHVIVIVWWVGSFQNLFKALLEV